MPGKTLMYCVEPHFVLAKSAMEWSLQNVVDQGDSLHVVTILPPVVYAAAPASPIATEGAVNAVTSQWEAQKRRDEMVAADTLKRASELIVAMDLKLRGDPHTHALPAAGGASGIAMTISEYANAREVDLVILGGRGMGSLQRSILSLVGLGSVSDHVVNNCHCPVLVVRQDCMETFTVAQPLPVRPQQDPKEEDEGPINKAPRKICFAYDSSEKSQSMLRWALSHLVRKETDELHIVTVGKSALQNYPVAEDVMVPGPHSYPQANAFPNIESDTFTAAQKQSTSDAEKIARLGVHIVQTHEELQFPLKQVFCKGLLTEGGASGAGEAICHYAKSNGINFIVAANRSMGGFKRAMSKLAGMGSVSLYCAHNASCPVLVFKE